LLSRERTLLKALLAVLSLSAIASVGGGFVLGLVLVPFHWVASRSASAWGRLVWAGLAATLVAENVWAAYFVTFGEGRPFIWLAPAFAFVVTAVAFFTFPGATTQRKGSEPA
jgi:hypothetical protein